MIMDTAGGRPDALVAGHAMNPQRAIATVPQPAPVTLSCFARPAPSPATERGWVARWRETLAADGLRLTDSQRHALARLLPLLVCGEQSAVAVFQGAARRRDRAAREMVSAFARIEHDELSHEAVWQTLYGVLPRPADLGALKRRAALFFARLGRTAAPAEHFAKVSQLDSAVGIIMWHLEHSAAARDPLIEAAALRIKRDEARHVSISRRYAAALGMPRDEAARLGEQIRNELIALLTPASADLEGLGIDPDALFRRISPAHPVASAAAGRVYAAS